MRTVGIVTTGVAAVVVLVVIVIGLISIPDINRYRKIRQM